MNLLRPVNSKIRKLKKKTKILATPWIWVNFSSTNVIMVTEIASTAKNPAFNPNTRKIKDANSTGLPDWKILEILIFSGDAKRGTLKIAFTRNKKNKDTETVFTWFCKRGNRKSIALPKTIPWKIPIPNALKIAITENTGSWKTPTKNEINAILGKLSQLQY